MVWYQKRVTPVVENRDLEASYPQGYPTASWESALKAGPPRGGGRSGSCTRSLWLLSGRVEARVASLPPSSPSDQHNKNGQEQLN